MMYQLNYSRTDKVDPTLKGQTRSKKIKYVRIFIEKCKPLGILVWCLVTHKINFICTL